MEDNRNNKYEESSFQKPAPIRMALTRALPPCGDNILAERRLPAHGCRRDSGRAAVAAGPSEWGGEPGAWPALQCNAESLRTRGQAGLSTPIRQRRVTGGEPSAWSSRAVRLRRGTKPATRRPQPRPRPVKPEPDAPRSRAEVGHYGALQQRGPRRLAIISTGWCGRLVGRYDPNH